MTKKDKIKIYERVLHRIALVASVGNTTSLQKILTVVDNWSYAHRKGNGELTKKEQQKLINAALQKLDEI